MKTVLKLQLDPIPGPQRLAMHRGANIIHVAEQAGILTIWYECDNLNTLTAVVFHVIGTGHLVQAGLQHVGTAFVGDFVWHLYVDIHTAPMVRGS